MSLDLNCLLLGDFYSFNGLNCKVLRMYKKEHSETELEKCYSGPEMTGYRQPLLLLLHFIPFLNKRLEVVSSQK